MRRAHLFATLLSMVLFSFASCKCNKTEATDEAAVEAPADAAAVEAAPADAAPAPEAAPADAAPAPEAAPAPN
jgi:hypothetical protein